MTMFICERGDIVIIFRKMFGRTTSVIRLIYNYSTVLFSDCIFYMNMFYKYFSVPNKSNLIRTPTRLKRSR